MAAHFGNAYQCPVYYRGTINSFAFAAGTNKTIPVALSSAGSLKILRTFILALTTIHYCATGTLCEPENRHESEHEL